MEPAGLGIRSRHGARPRRSRGRHHMPIDDISDDDIAKDIRKLQELQRVVDNESDDLSRGPGSLGLAKPGQDSDITFAKANQEMKGLSDNLVQDSYGKPASYDGAFQEFKPPPAQDFVPDGSFWPETRLGIEQNPDGHSRPAHRKYNGHIHGKTQPLPSMSSSLSSKHESSSDLAASLPLSAMPSDTSSKNVAIGQEPLKLDKLPDVDNKLSFDQFLKRLKQKELAEAHHGELGDGTFYIPAHNGSLAKPPPISTAMDEGAKLETKHANRHTLKGAGKPTANIDMKTGRDDEIENENELSAAASVSGQGNVEELQEENNLVAHDNVGGEESDDSGGSKGKVGIGKGRGKGSKNAKGSKKHHKHHHRGKGGRGRGHKHKPKGEKGYLPIDRNIPAVGHENKPRGRLDDSVDDSRLMEAMTAAGRRNHDNDTITDIVDRGRDRVSLNITNTFATKRVHGHRDIVVAGAVVTGVGALIIILSLIYLLLNRRRKKQMSNKNVNNRKYYKMGSDEETARLNRKNYSLFPESTDDEEESDDTVYDAQTYR